MPWQRAKVDSRVLCGSAPIFDGIPSSIDAGFEFSRLMRTYKPQWIVLVQPEFFADRFVGKSMEEALCAG